MAIVEWPVEDPEGWFDYVRRCWWASEWGWHEGPAVDDVGRQVYRYDISTGGWSGNESLIRAMKQNRLLWFTTWQMSRRGGHYRFDVVGIG